MDTNDLFIKATKRAYHYSSNQGDLTTEDLWRLPLTSKTGRDLDTVAKLSSRQLKALTEESFVTVAKPGQADAEAKLEIIKFVIKSKQDELAEDEKAAKRRQERDRLLEALASKQTQNLMNASEEEIRKRLDELDKA